MPPKYWLPVLGIATAFAVPAHAGSLTFAQALDRASATAPVLQARTLDIEAARASARTAGALPDPRMRIGLENFPISGPGAGRLGADEMTMASIGLTQDLPNRARRHAERSQAGANVQLAEGQAAIELRRIRLATALAWIDLYYAERRVAAQDEVLRALGPLWETPVSAVAAGTVRPAETLEAVRMKAALEDQRSELVSAVVRARAELTRWTGDPSPQVSGTPPDFHIDADRLRPHLQDNPLITVFQSRSAAAAAAVDLARSDKRPDVSLEASYGRRDPLFGDMISAGVSVRLPLRPRTKQDPIIAARTADAARMNAERDDASRELAAALEGDLADHVMHHEQWVRARDVLVPNARQQADLMTASYAARAVSLRDVLETFNQLAAANLDVLAKEAAVTRDGVRIQFTYGTQDQ